MEHFFILTHAARLIWADARRPLRRWFGGYVQRLYEGGWLSTTFLLKRVWLVDCIVEHEQWNRED